MPTAALKFQPRVRRGSKINSSSRRTALFRDAAFETFAAHFAGQVAADDNDSAIALLILASWPLVIAIKDHVDTLKDEALVVSPPNQHARQLPAALDSV